MIKRITLTLLGNLVVFATSTMTSAQELSAPVRYQACLEQVEKNPKEAFETATAWAGLGGGDAADHCAAVALFALGQFAESAGRLEKLAVTGSGTADLQADLLAQAGQAWLRADRANRAEAALTEALKIRSEDPGLLIDRAQARAALADYPLAIADLDLALDLDPLRADAFVFRASAKRLAGDIKGAGEDVERALKLDIVHPEGLLERGILHRLNGNEDGARADWLKILESAPDSAAAALAIRNLEKLDLEAR